MVPASRTSAVCRRGLPSRNEKAGFTLLELSIVLVIIGLIAGGVMMGKSLVQAAQTRKMLSQIEQYTLAINTFRTKYNCLPGDCPNATMFFSDSGNGDGNGQVDLPAISCSGDPVIYCIAPRALTASGGMEEVTLLNEHLAKAGLIALPVFNSRTDTISAANMPGKWYINLGRSALNLIALTTSKGRNVIRLAAKPFYPVNIQFLQATPSLDPVEAFYIDSKIDDGLPMSGQVGNEDNIGGGFYGDNAGCAITPTPHANSYTNAYDVNHTAIPVFSRSYPCELSLYNMF